MFEIDSFFSQDLEPFSSDGLIEVAFL